MGRTGKLDTAIAATALVAALALALALVPGDAGAGGGKKKRRHVKTEIYLGDSPSLDGVIVARHRCQSRRYIEIRRFGNDALVGSTTSQRDGKFHTDSTYSGPAYAYTMPGPRGKRWKCKFGLSAVVNVGVADLSVTVNPVAPGPETGGNPAFDLTVLNAGPDSTQDVVVVLRPDPVQLLGTFELDAADSTSGCARDAATVQCRIFIARPRTPVTVRAAIQCTGTTTSLLAAASVTASARDPQPLDNDSTGVLASCL